MSLILQGSTSGSITLQEPAVAGSTVLDLPATSGTLITTGSTGQVIPKAALPTGSVLQVVSTTKTDTFVGSVQTNTWTDITGMSVSITPTSASSKILVFVFLYGGSYDGIEKAPWRLMRNSTAICIGDAAGNRGQASGDAGGQNTFWPSLNGNVFLDSPSTTSSTTYKCQYVTSNAGVFYVNRCQADRDTSASVDARTASSITVMEIAA